MNKAVKHDKGKPRPDLVLGDFMLALMHVIFVGTFGCYKYAPRNFQGLEDGEERYAEAAFRHYMDRKAKGELFDRETGEYHLAHEIWDKIAELYFFLKNNEGVEYRARVYQDAPQGRIFWTTLGWIDEGDDVWLDEEVARQAIWRLQGEGLHDVRVEKVEKIPEWNRNECPPDAELTPWWGLWDSRSRVWIVDPEKGGGRTHDPLCAWRTDDKRLAERTAGEFSHIDARRVDAWGVRHKTTRWWLDVASELWREEAPAEGFQSEETAAAAWSDLDTWIRELSRVEPLE